MGRAYFIDCNLRKGSQQPRVSYCASCHMSSHAVYVFMPLFRCHYTFTDLLTSWKDISQWFVYQTSHEDVYHHFLVYDILTMYTSQDLLTLIRRLGNGAKLSGFVFY